MIQIDSVYFNMSVPSEDFARNMYSRWDLFCHKCFRQVVEECLADYEKEDVCYEMDKVEIDLGTIPDEVFYEEYPRRLREELCKISFPSIKMTKEKTGGSFYYGRLADYLRYGITEMSVDVPEYNLEKMTGDVYRQPEDIKDWTLRQMAVAVLTDFNALRRLVWQAGDSNVLKDVFGIAMKIPGYSYEQKRLFLLSFLELRPDVAVRFIHDSDDVETMDVIAELMDGHSVRIIMQEELKDLFGGYSGGSWHSLYNWLLHYYPFGLTFLGHSVSQFRDHMHRQLLAFMRNTGIGAYTTGDELTAGFLRWVFGREEVAGIVEYLVSRAMRGTVEGNYGSDPERQFYKTFMNASLLDIPYEADASVAVGKGMEGWNGYGNALKNLTYYVKDNSVGTYDMQRLVLAIADRRPEIIARWIMDDSMTKEIMNNYVIPVVSGSRVNAVIASISVSLLHVVSESWKCVARNKDVFECTRYMSVVEMERAWNKSVLMWLYGKTDNFACTSEELQNIFYYEVCGCDIPNAVILEEEDGLHGSAELVRREWNSLAEHVDSLKDVMCSGMSEDRKRMETALFWDCYRDCCLDAIDILCREGLLSQVASMTDRCAIKEIIRLSAIQVGGKENTEVILRVYELARKHNVNEGSGIRYAFPETEVQILLWLEGNKDNVTGLSAKAVVEALSEVLFGEHNVEALYKNKGGSDLVGIQPADSLHILSVGLPEGETEDYADGRGQETASEELLTEVFVNGALPEGKREVLEFYISNRPKALLEYIRHSVLKAEIAADRWSEWIDSEGWRTLACAVSVSATELFIRVVSLLRVDDHTERRLWAAYIAGHGDEEWLYNTAYENVRQFVHLLFQIQGEEMVKFEKVVQDVAVSMGIGAVCEYAVEEQIYMKAQNAGLCLLAPWFLRLYDIVGYLDDDHRTFRNTSSKIRAVFLLQYLAYGEEREYSEQELCFNRLLADIPFAIPLPKRVVLTDEEKKTADGMIAGVKANWQKMDGTSVDGFRRSFISRSGVMSQQDDHWVITMEEQACDILLDTVPWGFRQIRLPWLKTFIQVVWQDKHLI